MGNRLTKGYRLLLRTLPFDFRLRFGTSMEETFADGVTERGGARSLLFAVRNYLNLIVTAVAVRFTPSRYPSSHNQSTRKESMLRSIMKDIHFALRTLRRQPAFASVAILTIALGIGANTAIFSVIDGVLLTPLPYSNPKELITVGTREIDDPQDAIGHMDPLETADIPQLRSIGQLVGYSTGTATITGDGDPLIVPSGRVSGGLLDVFNLNPILGRDIRPEENSPTAPRVVLLSYRYWQQHFGGSPDAVGQTVEVSERPHEIIGVAPADFNFPNGAQLWFPYRVDPDGCARGCRIFRTIGRLESGVKLETARGEVAILADNLATEYPATNFETGYGIIRLRDQVVGDVREGLLVVLGAVGIVLLIACANVAILLLVRANARQGEVAIRAALGASRGRLIRQVLLESQVVALVGATAGLVLAAGSIGLLKSLSPGTIPRIDQVGLNGSVLAFTLASSIFVALLFGIVPAVTLGRKGISRLLVTSGRGAGDGKNVSRFRFGLLVTEIALSILLLVGSGLLLKTFSRMYAVDLGFETSEVLRFSLSIPSSRYASLDEVSQFYSDLEERIEALPGVAEVGSVFGAPLGTGNIMGGVEVEGRPKPEPGEDTYAAIRPVTPGYLDAMRIPVLRGRGIEPTDRNGTQPVGVVNETFVRENFPDEDPIGKRVYITASFGFSEPTWTIVGVVPDIRTHSLTKEGWPEIYVPHTQFGPGFMTVAIRGVPGAPALLPAIRREVRALDSNVPVRSIETMEEAVERKVAPTRFYLFLIGTFAVLAVVLSAVGLYGVVAYVVSRRVREIGIRLALGAKRSEILRLVVFDGMRPALLGLVVGLGAAWAAVRIVESLLFQVRPRDPFVFGGVAALIFAVAFLATLLPARSASRVDPVQVMRVE